MKAKPILMIAALCLLLALLSVAAPSAEHRNDNAIDYKDYLDIYLFLGESGQYYNYGYEVTSHAVPYDFPTIEDFDLLNFDALEYNLRALGTDESAEVELMKQPRFSKGLARTGQMATLAITHDRHDEIIEVMEDYPAEVLVTLSNKQSYRYTIYPVIMEPTLEPQTI